MMRNQAVADIQMYLGFRTDLNDQIISMLQRAQVDLENSAFLPWFLIAETATTLLVPGESRLAPPDDFIQEVEEGALWYYNSTADTDAQWTELRKLEDDDLREYFQSTAGAPKAYTLDGQYFRIYPTPDLEYSVKLRYYARAATLDANIENAWLKYAPDLIIGQAGAKIAFAARDATAVAKFQEMEMMAKGKLIASDTARRMANYRPIMGGPD